MAHQGFRHVKDRVADQVDVTRYVAWYPTYNVDHQKGVELAPDDDEYAYVKFMIPSDFLSALEIYAVVNPATMQADADVHWQIDQIWWGQLAPIGIQPNLGYLAPVTPFYTTLVQSGPVNPYYCSLGDFLPDLLATAASAALAKGIGGEISLYREGTDITDTFTGSIWLNRMIMRYLAEQ